MPQFPQDKTITLNGLEFHYRDWGGSGQPMALLHGLASNCRIWDLVAPLLAQDFAVVTLDQRGHGLSAKPDTGYDFATIVSDLTAFIEQLGLERPIIAGHSWGGDVALEFAVAHPEIARGLCFVDGGMIEVSARPGMTLERAKVDMAPPDLTSFTAEQFRQRVLSRHQGSPYIDQVVDIVLATFAVMENLTIRPNLTRENHLRIIEALWEHYPSKLYPLVKCPTLLLPARQQGVESLTDRTLRRERSVAVATSLLPLSKLVWLEDSIHDVPIQRPELVASLIREHFQNGFFATD